MIFGHPAKGATATVLQADETYISPAVLGRAGRASKLTFGLDGLGSGIGSQVLRGVIYDSAGRLRATSAEVPLTDNAPFSWVDFSLLEGTDYPTIYTNLVTEPSFEVGISTWNAYANPNPLTITQSSVVPAVSGSKVLKVTNGGVANNGGASNNGAIQPISPGESIHISAYVRAASTTRDAYMIVGWTLAGVFQSASAGTASVNSVSGQWTRVGGALTAPGGVDGFYVYVVFAAAGNMAAGEVHYIDAVQVVKGSTQRDYFDGSVPGHRWNGAPHASTSSGPYSSVDYQGVALEQGTYRIGLLAGITDSSARVWGEADATGLTFPAHYNEGGIGTILASSAGNSLSGFATYSPAYTPPDNVDDVYLARLGYEEAQAALGATAPVRNTARRGAVGWHGSLTDPERGSFTAVKQGGIFADLVGERIKVSYQRRSVVAYVHQELDIAEDLSLTRRLFATLAPLATEELAATIEVLAETD